MTYDKNTGAFFSGLQNLKKVSVTLGLIQGYSSARLLRHVPDLLPGKNQMSSFPQQCPTGGLSARR